MTTLDSKDTVLQTCSERKDEWEEVVQARILHFHDLPAADAIYHQACSVNFRTKKQVPPRGRFKRFRNPPKRNQLLRSVIEKEAPNAMKTRLLSLHDGSKGMK